MCTVLLPPGVNPIAVNKYFNISMSTTPQGGHKFCWSQKHTIFLLNQNCM